MSHIWLSPLLWKDLLFSDMPRKKKPFIQKKDASTYSISVGHNDFTNDRCTNKKNDQEGGESSDRKSVSDSSKMIRERENRKEILDLCLFDDGYDYTQHLRSIETDASVKVSSAMKRNNFISSTVSQDMPKPNVFTDRCMESEILEVIETIETIELSVGEEQETGELDDAFFLEAMQAEKVHNYVNDNSIHPSEAISMSSVSTHRQSPSVPSSKNESGDNCALPLRNRDGGEDSRRMAKNVQANRVQTHVTEAVLKTIPDETPLKINSRSREVKYTKTRLVEENLQMLKETFSNTPSIIIDDNEKTNPSAIVEDRFIQDDAFLVNNAIPENWRWNIRRKGEDRSEKLQRKHAVKEGRRAARLAKKTLKKSFKELERTQ